MSKKKQTQSAKSKSSPGSSTMSASQLAPHLESVRNLLKEKRFDEAKKKAFNLLSYASGGPRSELLQILFNCENILDHHAEALRWAEEIVAGGVPEGLFLKAVSLRRQGRHEEGIEAGKKYLSLAPNGHFAEEAQRLVASPVPQVANPQQFLEELVRSPEGLRRAKQILLDEQQPGLNRLVAIVALGYLGGEPAGDALLSFLRKKNQDLELQERALFALGKLGIRSAECWVNGELKTVVVQESPYLVPPAPAWLKVEDALEEALALADFSKFAELERQLLSRHGEKPFVALARERFAAYVNRQMANPPLLNDPRFQAAATVLVLKRSLDPTRDYDVLPFVEKWNLREDALRQETDAMAKVLELDWERRAEDHYRNFIQPALDELFGKYRSWAFPEVLNSLLDDPGRVELVEFILDEYRFPEEENDRLDEYRDLFLAGLERAKSTTIQGEAKEAVALLGFQVAQGYFDFRKPSEAMKLLLRVTEYHPKDLEAKLLLADVFADLEEPLNQIATLENVIREHPDHYPAYLDLANCHFLQNDPVKQAELLSALLVRNPRHAQAAFDLIENLQDRGLKEEAEKVESAMLALDRPVGRESTAAWAAILCRHGHHDQVLKMLDEIEKEVWAEAPRLYPLRAKILSLKGETFISEELLDSLHTHEGWKETVARFQEDVENYFGE